MKKLLLVVLLLFAISCDKEGNLKDPTKPICASCTESVSGLTFEDYYCGTPQEVDYFITNLYQMGNQAGQHWSCTKH